MIGQCSIYFRIRHNTKRTYDIMSKASDAILAWASLVILLVLSPSLPRSYNSMQPFSLKVYNIWRELSTSILTMASSSYNAAFIKAGIKYDNVLVEWLTFFPCLPNQPSCAWKKSFQVLIIKIYLHKNWNSHSPRVPMIYFVRLYLLTSLGKGSSINYVTRWGAGRGSTKCDNCDMY